MTHAPAITGNGPDIGRLWTDAPALTMLALLLALGLIPLYATMALDPRLFDGGSPWTKPVKFHYALAVYALTLAFFARYMPAATRQSRLWRGFMAAVVIAIVAEVVWLIAAAMLNTASHFNTDVPFFTAIYGLMGIFAVLLTSASLFMGLSIWRNPASGLPPALQDGIAAGLVLTFALTVPVAGYLASSTGHLVGTGTRGLWLMGWSRNAGDLRVAHFLATHALHFIPFSAWAATRLWPAQARRLTTLCAALFVALVIGTFVQALNGQPFLPFLG